MGLLNPFLVTLSFHIGLLLTSPVSGVALISTLPIWQPFVARIFLKEKIEIKVIIGAFITIIGTLILFNFIINPKENWRRKLFRGFYYIFRDDVCFY